MASVALASLRATLEFEIQQPSPRVLPDELQQMSSLLEDLAPLQAFLEKFHIKGPRKDAETRDMEVKIKRFALQAEDDIEIQLRNIIVLTKLKEDTTRREELRRSLGKIRKEIDGLLQFVNKHSDDDDSSKLPSHQDIPSQLLDKWRSQTHEVEMVGRRKELMEIKNVLSCLDAGLNVLSIWGMGGIGKTTLAKKIYEELKHWELKNIEKELESLGILSHNIRTLIYNQLPEDLKVYLLYLGVFPKRSEIQVKTLLRLWIAEGLVKQTCSMNIEESAYRYLVSLIDRSLVLICNLSSDGKIKSCRLHSALHSFSVVEAQKEGIFCAVNTLQHLGLPLSVFANSCRWLSLYKHGFDYYVLLGTNMCRSIFFFCENSEAEFVPLKFSRVLALVPSPFLERENLGNLVFLRYLHVNQWFEGLEDIVPSNPNLQVFIVSHKGTSSFQLPSKIWETPKLIRHVEVSYSLSVDPPSEVRESLQTLYWLSLHHCSEKVFSRILNVKKLGIICGGGKGSSPTEVECDNLGNLGYLGKLETLMIAFRKGSPKGLQNLKSLPLHLNIKKLKLKRTCLAWSEINVVGMLPNLEILKLKEASNGSDWKCSRGNFNRLKFLYVEAKNLVRWEINECGYQFLVLQHLVLKGCTELEAIPAGFEYARVLQSIEFINCSLSVKESAQEISNKLARKS